MGVAAAQPIAVIDGAAALNMIGVLGVASPQKRLLR